jgi:transcription initiation factor IIE alpha subunit
VSGKKGKCPKCGMKLTEKKMEMKKEHMEKGVSHEGHNHN